MADYLHDVYLLNVERNKQFNTLNAVEQKQLEAMIRKGFEILSKPRYLQSKSEIIALIKPEIDRYLDTTKDPEKNTTQTRATLLESTDWAAKANEIELRQKNEQGSIKPVRRNVLLPKEYQGNIAVRNKRENMGLE